MNNTYGIRRSFNLENNFHFQVIENDVFDVSKRLKEIDKNLYLVFNRLHECYEVHDITQPTTSFTISFDDLNSEILDILNKIKARRTLNYSKEQRSNRRRYEDQRFEQMQDDKMDLVNLEMLLKRT